MQTDDLKKIISKTDNSGLLLFKIILDQELKNRKISFEVGDLGENLVIDFFKSTAGLPNLIAAPKGAKNVDALSRDGERYSIKTAFKAKKTGTIYPDSQNSEKQLFEFLIVASLNQDYQLHSLYSYSWDAFAKARAWDKRMNAWYIPLSNKRLKLAKKLFSDEKE